MSRPCDSHVSEPGDAWSAIGLRSWGLTGHDHEADRQAPHTRATALETFGRSLRPHLQQRGACSKLPSPTVAATLPTRVSGVRPIPSLVAVD